MAVLSDLHGLSAEDVIGIQAVLMKYGFLIDDRGFDRLGEVFTENAVVDYRPGGAGPFSGLADLQQAMKTMRHPVQHMMVSHIVDGVSGDEVVTRNKALIPAADRRHRRHRLPRRPGPHPGRLADQRQIHPQLPLAGAFD